MDDVEWVSAKIVLVWRTRVRVWCAMKSANLGGMSLRCRASRRRIPFASLPSTNPSRCTGLPGLPESNLHDVEVLRPTVILLVDEHFDEVFWSPRGDGECV